MLRKLYLFGRLAFVMRESPSFYLNSYKNKGEEKNRHLVNCTEFPSRDFVFNCNLVIKQNRGRSKKEIYKTMLSGRIQIFLETFCHPSMQ